MHIAVEKMIIAVMSATRRLSLFFLFSFSQFESDKNLTCPGKFYQAVLSMNAIQAHYLHIYVKLTTLQDFSPVEKNESYDIEFHFDRNTDFQR